MSSKYDIVLFGATGFTGRQAVSYVAKQYKGTLKWAVAGRNKAKLEELARTIGMGFPDIIVADSGDEASIRAMCQSAKVVATMAGPFSRYGTPVVKMCVETGADYCDITGELAWVREMVATYDDDARKSGSRIVHLCGHDSVPWDLCTLMLAKKLKEDHEEELASVDYFDQIRSKPSGGTLETAFGIMFGPEKTRKKSEAEKALGYDALLRTADGTASSNKVTVRNVKSLQRGTPFVRTLFFMAGVNALAVKRSNALNNYGKNVRYCEGQAFSSLWKAVLYLFGLIVFGLGIAFPPTRWLLKKYVLPKPGEGPSEEEMANGFLTVTGHAKGSKGSTAKAMISFSVDPGYKDTARMLVESALSLSLEGDKLDDTKGGVFTPAACQGTVLLDRLLKTGSAFSYM